MRYILASLIGLAFVAVGVNGVSKAATGDQIVGNWRATGSYTPKNPKQGGTRRVSCRISVAKRAPQKYSMAFTCTPQAGNPVTASAQLTFRGGSYSGRTFGEGGALSGSVTIRGKSLSARGPKGSARLTMRR